MRRFKEFLYRLSLFVVVYLLFSLINWTFNVSQWGDFSVFCLGLLGLVIIINEL
jgi:hypothetical protein